MNTLHQNTIKELWRLYHQAARLAVKNPAHARLAIFLSGYLKMAGGA